MQTFHDDTTLSVLLSKDDIKAFDVLYYKYYKAVFANISKLVHQQEAAEDILQDVFAALWENRKKLDIQQAVGGWLFVVSFNKSINFLRRSVLQKILPLEEKTLEMPDQEQPDTIEYQYHLINSAIESLPPAKKRVFILCKLQGKSYEEAALAIGISRDTVKEYITSSLKFIRKHALRRRALDSPLTYCALISILNHF